MHMYDTKYIAVLCMSFSSKYLGVYRSSSMSVCACVTVYILSFRGIKAAILNCYIPRIGLVRVES